MTKEQKDFLSEQIERITPKLTSRLRRKFPTDQVEDILQDVYLAAARKVDMLMTHPNVDGWFIVAADLKGWEVHLYHKRCRDMFASFEEYQDYLSNLSADTEDSIDDILPPETSPKDRAILKMYYELRLTTTEIGESLGVKPNTANQMLKRARCRLKKLLAEGMLLLLLH